MGYQDISFQTGTRFLITGAAGFIGSNLVEAVLKMGCRARGLDNFLTGKKTNIAGFAGHPGFEMIEGDVRDFETCLAACDGVDYVLHQAALGSVPRSMREPLIYEDINVKGTSNLMEAARLKGVKRFVFASSSSVYGDSQKLPKVEGEEGGAISPYALTKMVNEQYGRLYTKVYGLECIGLRYFNVFGKRQDPDSEYAAVIPKFIKLLKAGKQPEIYGDGEQTRDFTYIENVIEANLKACLAPKEACGESYNIAFGEKFTVNEICRIISGLLGADIKPRYVEPRAGDVRHSLADISKAGRLLGYSPDWDFKKGIKAAIDWYKANI